MSTIMMSATSRLMEKSPSENMAREQVQFKGGLQDPARTDAAQKKQRQHCVMNENTLIFALRFSIFFFFSFFFFLFFHEQRER